LNYNAACACNIYVMKFANSNSDDAPIYLQSPQWHGNYFWTWGARPRAPKSGTRNKGLLPDFKR